MSDHTPEPWIIGNQLGEILGKMTMIGGGKLPNGKPYALAGVFRFEGSVQEQEESAANARRIVACVNACATIETEQLEATICISLNDHCREMKKIMSQRDELLAALKYLAAEEWRDDDDAILDDARMKARVAIQKAESHA